jgi:hypothetical protein
MKVKQELEDYSGLSDMGEEGGMSEYDIAAWLKSELRIRRGDTLHI